MNSLNQKVVIVTGASAGIGEATARTLSRAGAIVVLAARRRDRLEQLRQELEATGGRVAAIPTDITDELQRRALVDETLRQFGRIDALVNNAGFGQAGPIETVPVEKIRLQFETNVFSLLALTQLVLPVMRAQRSGRIIIIGSVAGRIARPFSAVYDATKHALEAFSDGLRNEVAPFGLQVVLIEPGFIGTEFADVATNISAPTLKDQASPYAPFLSYRDAAYRQYRRYAASPLVIADLVQRALQAGTPRSRYAGPLHAKLFLFLRWLLPDSAFDWISRRTYGLKPENLLPQGKSSAGHLGS